MYEHKGRIPNLIDMSIGSLSIEDMKDVENIIRPRFYAHYSSECTPDWVRGILPPTGEPLEGRHPIFKIEASCLYPNTEQVDASAKDEQK
jgi:hypothetical protein